MQASIPRRPSLAAAAPPSRIPEIVEKLLTEHERYLGTSRPPRVVSLTVRPRRLSDVGILDLAVANHPLRLFVKMHKKAQVSVDHVRRKAGIEYDTLGLLHRHFAAIPGYGVVRPVAFLPEDLTVVTEAAVGENLHHLIKRGIPIWRKTVDLDRLTSACRASGVWLQHFQAMTRQPSSGPVPAERLLAGIRDDLVVCRALGLSRRASGRIGEFAEAQAARLASRDYAVTGQHPDYQPDNVLVAPGALTVLDFTSLQYGPPASDVARFLSILIFLRKNPLYSRSRLQALANVFLEGYGARDAETASAVALYLVRFVVQAVRTVPTWPLRWPLPGLMGRQAAALLGRWAREIAGHDAPQVVGWIP